MMGAKVSTSKLPDNFAEVRPSSSAALAQSNLRLIEDIAGGYRQGKLHLDDVVVENRTYVLPV
jgi:DNA-directed RNA polymerase sigma subunit (sigma70/sigma32)